MGRPLKTTKAAGIDTGFPSTTSGVVGGNTSIAGSQILCRVKVSSNSEANGYIIRQKGKNKFLVSDGTNTGVCTLANTANAALADDTMTVTCTYANSSTFRAKTLSNHHVTNFSDVKFIADFTTANASTTPYATVTVANS